MPSRCPNGTRRSKKSGLCESKKRKVLKRMTGKQVRELLIRRTKKKFRDYWKREHPGERVPPLRREALKLITRRGPNSYRRNYKTANCDFMDRQ